LCVLQFSSLPRRHFFLTVLEIKYTFISLTGLFTAVRKDHFRVVRYREWPFNDCGDRVAQLLHVQSVIPFPQSQTGNIRQETLVVNTHLMFPHDSDVCLVRLRQVLHFSSTYLFSIISLHLHFLFPHSTMSCYGFYLLKSKHILFHIHWFYLRIQSQRLYWNRYTKS
jgi:hypothetical protein